MPTPKIQVEDGSPIDLSEVIKLVGGTGISIVRTQQGEKAVVTFTGDGSDSVITDSGGYFTTDTVDGALAELGVALRFAQATFTETAAAGTYTATIPLPDGCVVAYVAWRSTAAWANTTAALDLGITGALTLWGSAIDVDLVGADTIIPDPGGLGPTAITTEDFIAKVVAAGGSGTTGRLKVWVGYFMPVNTAATKV